MRKIVLAFFPIMLVGVFSGCATSNSRATCFDCTKTPQKWSDFSFNKLEGTWRGTQELYINNSEEKDIENKKLKVEVTFLEGKKFLHAYKITENACKGFPAESVVLMNELWWDKGSTHASDQREFEVFARLDHDQVGYGRAYIKNAASGNTCEYFDNGQPITMNRLALPAVAYSRRITPDGRVLASGPTKEVDINLEFLNFDYAKVDDEYRWNGKEKEAPLFFRFVKTTRSVDDAFDQGQWQATEEKLFRLWPVQTN